MRNCIKSLKIYIKTARFFISNIKKACSFYHLLALNCQFLAATSSLVVYRPYSGMLTPRSSSRPPAYDKHINISKTTLAIRHFADISSAGRPAEAVSA